MENLKLALTEPVIAPLVPDGARGKIAALWDVHERLATLSMTGNEPALKQIRLIWWRDALAGLTAGDSAPAEPLLERAARELVAPLGADRLAALADARYRIVATDWAPFAIVLYGQLLFQMLASLMETESGGGAAWALTEVALGSADPVLAQYLMASARFLPVSACNPKPLRALDGLARSIAGRDGRRARAREQALVLRIGLFGR